MCLDPLVCLDAVCTWPPPSTTGTDDGSTSGADSGTDSGVVCSAETCPSIFDFCNVDDECTDIRDAAYEVTVSSWTPGLGCSGGALDGDADLYWQLEVGNAGVFVVVAESSWTQGGCPGSWSSESYCLQPGVLRQPFLLEAWDYDGGQPDDELQDSLWWDDGTGHAAPLSPLVLLEGVYEGTSNTGGAMHVEFTRLDACE